MQVGELQRALAALKAKESEKALELMQASLECPRRDDRRRGRAHFNMAAALNGLGRRLEAILSLSAALAVDPTNHGALNLRSIMYEFFGDFDRAEQVTLPPRRSRHASCTLCGAASQHQSVNHDADHTKLPCCILSVAAWLLCLCLCLHASAGQHCRRQLSAASCIQPSATSWTHVM